MKWTEKLSKWEFGLRKVQKSKIGISFANDAITCYFTHSVPTTLFVCTNYSHMFIAHGQTYDVALYRVKPLVHLIQYCQLWLAVAPEFQVELLLTSTQPFFWRCQTWKETLEMEKVRKIPEKWNQTLQWFLTFVLYVKKLTLNYAKVCLPYLKLPSHNLAKTEWIVIQRSFGYHISINIFAFLHYGIYLIHFHAFWNIPSIEHIIKWPKP